MLIHYPVYFFFELIQASCNEYIASGSNKEDIMLLNRKHSLVSCFDLELLETHPVKIKNSKVKQKNFITVSLEFSFKKIPPIF
ncbi:conserved hypothetical protein [Acinetobacter baumannii SDF]|uniref:Uncharacterized protein n=1 Tax=Acinetobacter baumannii (strain SDF) TaxID=509170 RepID=B0VKI0_ACIBS|nr:conserved hypothetical protein [Acinetobacter baumannii SDF]